VERDEVEALGRRPLRAMTERDFILLEDLTQP
jgi:hypothetical protein